MYLRGRRTKLWIIIGTTIIMLLFWIGINKIREQEFIYNLQTTQIVDSNSEMEIAVYYPLSRTIDGASDFLVRWWHNDIDNKYYIFLPSGIEERELYWLIQEESNIWIEQKKISSGDPFELSAGEYAVQIEKQGEYQNLMLEIMCSKSIPSLFIETETGKMDYVHAEKGNEEKGKYTVLDSGGKLQHAGIIEKMRGRGNGTFTRTEKKGYQLTLDVKTGLLSMPEEKQWILNPNAFDVTLLKNKICYDIARELDMPFTPEMEYVDLYINGEYRGNYLLMEKVEIGENRVAIRDLEKETEILNEQPLESMEKFQTIIDEERLYKGYYIPNQPQDITGGYLLELELPDRFKEETSGFITNLLQPVVIKSPQYASYEQVIYIKEKYQEMEDALFSEDGFNPGNGKHYSEYLDISSAISKYIVEEVSKNWDTGLTSQYLYKEQDSVSDKFYLGPAWDFDNTLGVEGVNGGGASLLEPENIHAGMRIRKSHLLYGLYLKEDFKNAMVDVFATKARPMITKEVEEVVPNVQERILESSKMNLIRWNCYGDIPLEEKLICYEEEVENIRNFIRKRVDFLKTEWGIE